MFTSHSSGATSPEADVEALLCLINSAAQDAMGIYKNSGYGVPSIHSTQIHPFDTETTTLALKKAIRVLEGACEQLCTTLAPPSHTLLNVCLLLSTPLSRPLISHIIAFYGAFRPCMYARRYPGTNIGHPTGQSKWPFRR